MADIKAEFYQWGMREEPIPDWMTAALADNTIVRDGDGDAFLVSEAGGRMRINPGDYLMHSMTTIFIIEEHVYDAITGSKQPALDDGAAEFYPPFSASVLARSARAREMQAEYDRTKPTPMPVADHDFPGSSEENAHVEGADVPDEPDLVSPDPPKST